jgi:hypothetical protein
MAEYLAQHVPQAPRKTTQISHLEWALEHVRLKGGAPFSFEGHAYLRQLYAQPHPDITLMKAAQTCGSTWCSSEALWLCDSQGKKAIFYLSTDDDAQDFSNDRINPIIDADAYLKSIVRTTRRRRDNVGLKHIGRGTLYVRGVESIRNVKSVDADLVVLDELDEANQTHVQLALDRLLHSDLRWIRRISQPSIPDYGIAREFGATDQCYWHLKCPACGHWQCLELETDDHQGVPMPRNFMAIPEAMRSRFPDDQTYYRGCLKCGASLDMDTGAWVARYPDRPRRGYHLSQFYTTVAPPGRPAPADRIMTDLLSARKPAEKMRVVVSIAGFPYGGDRQPITDAVIAEAEGDHGFFWRSENGCYLGVDMGNLIHAIVGDVVNDGRLRLLWMATLDHPDALDDLMQRYGIEMAVIDAMPDVHTSKAFALRHPGRVYIQYFSSGAAPWAIKESDYGEDIIPVIHVDRTLSLDETVDAVKTGEIILPASARLDTPDMSTYLLFQAHCKMLVKNVVTDARGRDRWEYKHGVENHFGMALNSLRIARKLAKTRGYDREVLRHVVTSGVKYTTAEAWEMQEF